MTFSVYTRTAGSGLFVIEARRDPERSLGCEVEGAGLTAAQAMDSVDALVKTHRRRGALLRLFDDDLRAIHSERVHARAWEPCEPVRRQLEPAQLWRDPVESFLGR